jgi:hypothetical protein
MRLALSALIVLGLIVATQAQAQAQVQAQEQVAKPSSIYAFEGFTYSRFHGQLTARASEAVQLQIGVGYQPSNSLWAYELMGRGGGTLDEAGGAGLLGWGLRAKRFIPLARHFNLYGRAGVTENLLTDSTGPDLVGFGLEYGAGAMASLKVRALGFLFWPAFFMGVGPKVNLSLWADLGGEVGNLHAGHQSSSESYDYRSTSASYGLTIGGQF